MDTKEQLNWVLRQLQDLENKDKVVLKQLRFGVHANNALGIYQADLKRLAKQIGKNDELALALFETGIYEARILCSKIYSPENITLKQMDYWASSFENWEICDSFCMGFFTKSIHALEKASIWSQSDSEFIKRAGFTIMAAYGFENKQAGNEVFESFLIPIKRQSYDHRVYVKKAINWALRNIGKRNKDLRSKAISLCYELLEKEQKSAQWIAKDALRELEKPTVSMLNYPRAIYAVKHTE